AVRSGGDPIHLVESVVAILGLPEETGLRIEGEAETIAASVRKNLADIRRDTIQLSGCERHAGLPFKLGDLIYRHIGEGIVAWGCTVRVEPEDASGQMGVVRRRPAELIIRLPRPEWTAGQILQLAAPAL